MTPGHKEAQRLFLEIGEAKGYQISRTFSESSPTDGVWFVPGSFGEMEHLPVAALEVAASESPKAWKGSIATIEEVSPAFGVLLLQDEVMRSRLGRQGWSTDDVELEIQRVHDAMQSVALRSKQRLTVMNMATLRYQHRMHYATSLIVRTPEQQIS